MNDILNSSLKELYTILESSYDGITISDENGNIIYMNPSCERIEGLKREYIVGKNIEYLQKTGMYPESVTLKVFKEKKPITVYEKTKLGKTIISTGMPIFNQGKIVKVVINVRDITELNLLKQELNEANKKVLRYADELKLLRLKYENDKIVINSKEMHKIISLAKHIALVDTTVLIQGESGVGKEVVSRFIHDNSNRKHDNFVKIDCGAIPKNLLESELFGYVKGAFTGANPKGKMGLVEVANKGTLFLDEIGELPLELQVKLLSVIQDRRITRIGSNEVIPVDIRIITATNKHLKEMVDKKTFRKDLYYRLNVVPINIPPLRERREDIYPLLEFFLNKFNHQYKLHKSLSSKAIKVMVNYHWPGNIREVRNIVERLIVTCFEDIIDEKDLPTDIKDNVFDNELSNLEEITSLKKFLDKNEKKFLIYVMNKSNSTLEMAQVLKVARNTVTRKLKKHNIKIPY